MYRAQGIPATTAVKAGGSMWLQAGLFDQDPPPIVEVMPDPAPRSTTMPAQCPLCGGTLDGMECTDCGMIIDR